MKHISDENMVNFLVLLVCDHCNPCNTLYHCNKPLSQNESGNDLGNKLASRYSLLPIGMILQLLNIVLRYPMNPMNQFDQVSHYFMQFEAFSIL